MANRSRATRQQMRVMELFRMGGRATPAGFARKASAATKSMLQERLDAGNVARKQGAKLFGELKGASTVAVNDPVNKKTLDRLLNWHKKLAGNKLSFPN